MKRKYSVNVGCRLDYADHEKFKRIKTKVGLANDSDLIRFLINDYQNEDADIRKIKSLLESIEESIESMQSGVSEKPQVAIPDNKSNDSETMTAMLKILISLAKANPRVLGSLKGEMPELFDDN